MFLKKFNVIFVCWSAAYGSRLFLTEQLTTNTTKSKTTTKSAHKHTFKCKNNSLFVLVILTRFRMARDCWYRLTTQYGVQYLSMTISDLVKLLKLTRWSINSTFVCLVSLSLFNIWTWSLVSKRYDVRNTPVYFPIGG